MLLKKKWIKSMKKCMKTKWMKWMNKTVQDLINGSRINTERIERIHGNLEI